MIASSVPSPSHPRPTGSRVTHIYLEASGRIWLLVGRPSAREPALGGQALATFPILGR